MDTIVDDLGDCIPAGSKPAQQWWHLKGFLGTPTFPLSIPFHDTFIGDFQGPSPHVTPVNAQLTVMTRTASVMTGWFGATVRKD